MDTALAARPDCCVELATAADDAAFRQVLRQTPLDGRIQVSLEREPSFFAAAQLEAERHYAVCSRDRQTGAVIAVASRSVRQRFINGQPRHTGYLSQLRVLPTHRHLTSRILRDGFSLLRQTWSSDEASFDLAVISADNVVARRILQANLPGLPHFTPVDRIVTMLLPVPRLGRAAIQRASAEPPDCSCQDQFAPVWSQNELARMDAFHAGTGGCLARWDQRSFKQVVVRGFSPWLGRCRWLLGLPATGAVLPAACLVTLAINQTQPEAFLGSVHAALAAARPAGLRWLTLGLSVRHPFTRLVQRRYRPNRYESILYVVHEPGTTVRLDDRISHVEVASL